MMKNDASAETSQKPAGNGGGVAMAQGAVAKGEKGWLVATGELTEMQRLFVTAVVTNGGNLTKAAEAAGYSVGKDGYRTMALPHVRAAVAAEREKQIQGEGACLAWATMRELLAPDQKAQVRFQAAKWVLEAAGCGLAAHAIASGMMDTEKPLGEMTVGELERFIAESEKRLKQARVVEVVSQTVTQTGTAPDTARNAGEAQG